MNPDQILPARLDWPSAIGNFLLNFGVFDHLVFVFLKDHLAESDFEKVRTLHLKDRLLRIVKYLEDEKRSPEEIGAFQDLMLRTDVVRILRNHLAHGHMLMRFDPESKSMTMTVTKSLDLDREDDPDTKHLDFADMKASLKTLTDVIEEFKTFAGYKDAE